MLFISPPTDIATRTRNYFSRLFYFTLPVKQLTGTRYAGMPLYEDETISQIIKSSFKVFFFPWKAKKEGIERLLSPQRQLGVQHMGITEIKKAPSIFCPWSNLFFPWVTGNSRVALLHAAWAGAGTRHPAVPHHSSCPISNTEVGFNPKCRPVFVGAITVYLWFCLKNSAEPFSSCIYPHRVRSRLSPWAQLYKPALSGRLLEQTHGFQQVCTAAASGWERRKPWCWWDKRCNSSHQTRSELYCLSNADGSTSIYWKGLNRQCAAHLPLPLIQTWRHSALHGVRPEVMIKKREGSFAS